MGPNESQVVVRSKYPAFLTHFWRCHTGTGKTEEQQFDMLMTRAAALNTINRWNRLSATAAAGPVWVYWID